MSVVSFSEPSHVSKIIEGRKRQTTRKPRINPLKPGEKIQLYYKPRMKKCCRNCISNECVYAAQGTSDYIYETSCSRHDNFFGTAKIIKVEDIDFFLLSPAALEVWAVADGFESWVQADKWFIEHYGPKWTSLPFVVITWEPTWFIEEKGAMA
jgi:hypothetical protein